MISIVNKMEHNLVNIAPRCHLCGDSGRITLYRSDWEAFDEINCENCNSSTS